jgi:hypothetical protein
LAANGYTVSALADVAANVAAAQSVLGVKSGAAFGLKLKYAGVSFDGVAAGAEPVVVQVCHCTFATNGTPGTNNTDVSANIEQQYGRVLAHGVAAMRDWTAEPTVINVLDEDLLTPNGGTLKWHFPLGDEPDCGFSEGFLTLVIAPAAVNVRSTLKWERC